MQIVPAAFRHRPALALGPVEDGVDADMVFRNRPGRAAAPPAYLGRKDAADEGDDSEGAAAVIAQRGRHTTKRNHPMATCLSKGESSRIVRAAWRPESAAIGRPGPGWIAPPAR